MGNKQLEQNGFLEGADKNLHNNIMHLDKKLKSLLKAIELKMQGAQRDELTLDEKKQLPILAEEVKKALTSIENIVNTVTPEGFTHQEFTEINQETLQSLQLMFAGDLKTNNIE